MRLLLQLPDCSAVSIKERLTHIRPDRRRLRNDLLETVAGAVLVGLLTMVLSGGPGDPVVTISIAAVLGATVIFGVKFVGRFVMARGDILADRLSDATSAIAALGSDLEAYRRKDAVEHWDNEIERYRELARDFLIMLDSSFTDYAKGGQGATNWEAVASAAEWPEPLPMRNNRPLADWIEVYGASLSENGKRLLAFAQRVFPPYHETALTPVTERSILGRELEPFEARWRRVRVCLDKWGDPERSTEGLRDRVDNTLEVRDHRIAKVVLYLEIAKNAGLLPQRRGGGDIGLVHLCRRWKGATRSASRPVEPDGPESE